MARVFIFNRSTMSTVALEMNYVSVNQEGKGSAITGDRVDWATRIPGDFRMGPYSNTL